jgi:hypothetical protein
VSSFAKIGVYNGSDDKSLELNWHTKKDIKRLTTSKKILWQKLRNKNNPKRDLLLRKYKAVCKLICSKIRLATLHAENSIINSNDVKKFYKFANHKLGSKKKIRIQTIQCPSGKLTTDPLEKAELFNTFFSNCYTDDNYFLYDMHKYMPTAPSTELSVINFPVFEVLSIVSNLSNSHTITPDGFSARTIKVLGKALAEPLSRLFELFFMHAYIPGEWKIGVVTPVHKNGLRSSVSNYRPISITSVLCRVMERIIKKQTMCYMTLNNYLCEEQHGFQERRSTTTSLMESTLNWVEHIDDGSSMDVLYFDLAKAFDSVVHSKIIEKLKFYGISDNLLRWFSEFLTDRFQCVSIDGTKSQYYPVRSGVPQGSVVGPLLFTIFVNDLPNYLNNNPLDKVASIAMSRRPNHIVKLYADDLKLFGAVNCGRDAAFIQTSIDRLLNWCCEWQLKVNASKCGVLHLGADNLNHTYYVNGLALQNLSTVIDLGVEIDPDLNFKCHIEAIVKKARARCAVFLRNYISRDASLMKRFFLSFVRPILETNSIIWSPKQAEFIDKIERVQRSFLSKVDGFKSLSYSNRLSNLSLHSLQYRRNIADLIFFFKLHTGQVNCNIDNYFNYKMPTATRGHSLKLDYPRVSHDFARRFFNYRIVELWNKLPSSALTCVTIEGFRRCLFRSLPDCLNNPN